MSPGSKREYRNDAVLWPWFAAPAVSTLMQGDAYVDRNDITNHPRAHIVGSNSHMAAQQAMGLRPERWPGAGRHYLARTAVDRPNLAPLHRGTAGARSQQVVLTKYPFPHRRYAVPDLKLCVASIVLKLRQQQLHSRS